MPTAPMDLCQVMMSSSAQTNSLRGHPDPDATDNGKRIKLDSDEHGRELQQDEQNDVKLEHKPNPELDIKEEPSDDDDGPEGDPSDPSVSGEAGTKVAETKLMSTEARTNVKPTFQGDLT